MAILNPLGVLFHAVVVNSLELDFLFKSILALCMKWLIFRMGFLILDHCLYRGIIAGGGKIKQYMGPEVNYIITSGGYDKKNFQEAKNVNSQIVFLRPSFIKDCFDENKFVSPQKQHLIIEN